MRKVLNVRYSGFTCLIAFLKIALPVGCLYLLSLYNYLLYHSLVELLASLVALALFIVGWNTRTFAQNNLMIILALGFLVVGIIDLLHMLSYKGMGVFPQNDANLPTQLWIGARYVEVLTLLCGAFYLGKKDEFPRPEFLLKIFLAVGVLLLIAIFFNFFPVCYLEGEGLTVFKVFSEYLISGGFLLAGIIFYKKREHLTDKILRLVLTALGLTILSEMSFTLYVDIYGFFNFLGHIFKFFSITLLYRALIEESLQNPYQLLFKKIVATNKDLEKKSIELEKVYRRLNEEMDKARAIHEQTLPDDLPEIKGISFAAHYHPALKLGGDFYNMRNL